MSVRSLQEVISLSGLSSRQVSPKFRRRCNNNESVTINDKASWTLSNAGNLSFSMF